MYTCTLNDFYQNTTVQHFLYSGGFFGWRFGSSEFPGLAMWPRTPENSVLLKVGMPRVVSQDCLGLNDQSDNLAMNQPPAQSDGDTLKNTMLIVQLVMTNRVNSACSIGADEHDGAFGNAL